MKIEFEYFYPLEHPNAYCEVKVPKCSFKEMLFCKHDMIPLVRQVKGDMYTCSIGDNIQWLCRKCGKMGELQFWEFEGKKYKVESY